MWTVCYGAAGADPRPKAVTVNEISRNVYICGYIKKDTTDKYQEFFVAKYSQFGELQHDFMIGTTDDHTLDYCNDLDTQETIDEQLIAVGSIRDSGGTKEAFLVRLDSNLENKKHFHWGGIGKDDEFTAVKFVRLMNKFWVLGNTASFNGKNDTDTFIMRVNIDLEIDYIKILVKDITDETMFHICTSRLQLNQIGSGMINTKDTTYNTFGLIVKWGEDSSISHIEFGNYYNGGANTDVYTYIRQSDVDYTNQYIGTCGERANAVFFMRSVLGNMTPDRWQAFGSAWSYKMQIRGCQWVQSTIRTSAPLEGSSFVAFGDTLYDATGNYIGKRNFFYIKMDYNMLVRTTRVFGKSGSNQYAISRMYLDQYGIVYFAGTTTNWCQSGENGMIIFKNNFDFDLWETHTDGNYFDRYILQYIGQSVAYPTGYNTDANTGSSPMKWSNALFITTRIVNTFYHKFESQYTVTSNLDGVTGLVTTTLFSDYQYQNGELTFKFYTNSINRVRVPRTCFKSQTTDYAGVVYYTYEHNTDYNQGSLPLNTVISVTDGSNYLYNDDPSTKGIHFFRISEKKNTQLIKDSLVKVIITDRDTPYQLRKMTSKRILQGTTTNWGLNANGNIWSTCFRQLFYQSDGSSIPSWIDYNIHTISGLTVDTFYVTNPKPSGTYEIKMTCADSYESTANDTFYIEIYNNAPYILKQIGSQYVLVGGPIKKIKMSDYFTDDDVVNGQTLTYSVTPLLPITWAQWILWDSNLNILIAQAPTGLVTKTYTFTVTVSDGELSVSQVMTLIVNNPVKMIKTFQSGYLYTNERILVNCSEYFQLDLSTFFSDEDKKDILTYSIQRSNGQSLPNWLGLSQRNILEGIASGDDFEILNLIVTVTDNKDSSINETLQLEVNCKPVDLGRLPDKLYTSSGSTLVFDFKGYFEDPNGNSLLFKVSGPSWITINNGQVQADGQSSGTFPFTLYICDEYQLCLTRDLSIVVESMNSPPKLLKDMPDQIVYSKTNFVFKVPDDIFSDADGDILSMSARQQPTQQIPLGLELPDWLTFSNMGNYFSGYTNQTQSLRIQLTFGDQFSSRVVYFKLIVLDDSAPVQNVQIPDQFSWSESQWEYTIPLSSFKDADIQLNDQPYYFDYNAYLVEGFDLPQWLNFNPGNRSFYSTKTQTGTYWIEISAADSQGNTNYMNFQLIIYHRIYDKENIYYSGVVIAVGIAIIIIIAVIIETVLIYMKIESTRMINNVKIEKIVGENPTRFVDRQKVQNKKDN
ncbi:ig family protein [Stylonychia lemnae]|uniref:Ig family protein n=1 Tax=Stylonychia lemnae TaxID=5949 RepID=A0A077ZUV5_STYLE|nr:ig family protein [Stylonychia lemnae]|eukprot:CDW73334.1 ig family protein [Stylonychia lemnae]